MPRGSLCVTTLKDLTVGSSFKLFARYKDGSRRPRLHYAAQRPSVTLKKAYLRFRGHSLNGVTMSIQLVDRPNIDFRDELTVVEHLKGGVTMVRDSKFALAPVWSGMKLQNRGPR
jgi:hypothetical protein